MKYHLGLAYHQSGEKVKAEQALQKAQLSLGEGPDIKATRELLAQLKNDPRSSLGYRWNCA